MKALTQEQIEMRDRILAAARRLIAQQGTDGFTMRTLALESNVALKTLYHQFTNKETLLRSAVEERFRHDYAQIDAVEFNRGIDRLLYVVKTIHETTVRNEVYAKALAPMLTSASGQRPFSRVRLNTYRRAIDQIAAEGELVEWVDIDLVTALVYRDATGSYLSWFTGTVPLSVVGEVGTLSICLLMASMTTGYSHDRAVETATPLATRHRGRTFL